MKTRTHNEWFRTVSLGGLKHCPTCNCRLGQGDSLWSHGEYVNARWHTVTHFCRQCFTARVQLPLLAHSGACGCTIALVGYRGELLPEWLTLAPVATCGECGKPVCDCVSPTEVQDAIAELQSPDYQFTNK